MLIRRKIFSDTFSRYALLGASSLLIKYALSIALTEYAGMWYFVSYLIALAMLAAYNFSMNFSFVFRVKGDRANRLAKYFFSIIIFNFTDAYLVKFFTDGLMIHYLVSIAIVAAIIFAGKYFFYKALVFKMKEL